MDHAKQQVADRMAEQIFVHTISRALATPGQTVNTSEAAKVARAAAHDYVYGGGTTMTSPARRPMG